MANGVIIWEGPSRIDGSPIAIVATGFPGGARSTNSKTDEMVQTWIIRRDMFPVEAVRSGLDNAICGDCPFGGGRGCYVRQDGPSSVYKAMVGYVEPIRRPDGLPNPRAGQVWGPYPRMHPFDAGMKARGLAIRFGSYGGPDAVPLWVWKAFLSGAVRSGTSRWTGYTHRWRNLNPATWGFLMASAETEEGYREAVKRGWRTFRVETNSQAEPFVDEILCPASIEAGQKTTCAACGLCNGTVSEGAGWWISLLEQAGRRIPPVDQRADIRILAHGQKKGLILV